MSFPLYDLVHHENEGHPWFGIQPPGFPLEPDDRLVTTGSLVQMLAWARQRANEDLVHEFMDEAVFIQSDLPIN